MPLRRPICPTPRCTNSLEPKAVTLGIDFGSTSTRAVLWCPEDGQEYHVESTSQNFQRFSEGDFSSIGYPFDGGEVYLGERSDAFRDSTSLKYAFYVLADAPDELVSQYQLSAPLRTRQREKGFRERLDEGIRNLFAAVYRRVLEVCRGEDLLVTTIGLSIPSQWTVEFIELYRGIVADVFKHHPKDIFFVTEVEALARYLCTKKMKRLVQHQNDVHNAVVVVLDFGGHTMNTCTLNIVHEPDSLPAFYLIGEPKGAAGGSELWEYLLAERSLACVKSMHGVVPSPASKQKLLDSINKSKRNWGPECEDNEDFECLVLHQGRQYYVDMDEYFVEECFDRAMKAPLALAADRIGEAARIWQSQDQNKEDLQGREPTQKPRVILAGGTASNKGLVRKIEDMCHSNGLDSPVKTRDISIHYNSVKIASGAAFAVASPLTVEQFMKRGAAFGVQMRQQAEPGSAHQWDNTAAFLYSMRRPDEPIRISVRPHEELKIVCDPFFDKDDGNTKTTMYHDRCYDFIDLGQPTKGYWKFWLALDGHGDQMRLTVRRLRQYAKGKHPIQYEPVVLSLYYDRGSNSIHPGQGSCDYSQERDLLGLKQYPKPRAAQQDEPSQPIASPKVTKRPTARRGKSRKMPIFVAHPDKAARTPGNTDRSASRELGAQPPREGRW
ncbi:hypothetical protein KJ359_003222 [Pestalotiopsis sp. 9143b]|nr:hypothetical protein KJ359_003222 [Pestalotiopsis sp. 9143b]